MGEEEAGRKQLFSVRKVFFGATRRQISSIYVREDCFEPFSAGAPPPIRGKGEGEGDEITFQRQKSFLAVTRRQITSETTASACSLSVSSQKCEGEEGCGGGETSEQVFFLDLSLRGGVQVSK